MIGAEETRVLVVGCGGIGGVVSTKLRQAGVDLTIATTNESVKRALAERGPVLDGQPLAPPMPADQLVSRPADAKSQFDIVFVAVQPTEIDDVGRDLKEHLSEKALVVCLPNGLCEDRLAEMLGPDHVVGAVVSWGARMPQPGEYVQTSEGGFKLGSFDSHQKELLPVVKEMLETVAPVVLTTNLRGARFTKLAFNCAVSTLGTIGGSTLGELLLRGYVRDLALDILTEAVRVARAEGTRLENVVSLDLEWLASLDEHPKRLKGAARHAVMLAIGARYRNLRSSMLAAIERGRAPSVDFLNGEIVRRGAAHHVATPVNEAARQVVWEIAKGQRAAGEAALRRVRELSELLQERAPQESMQARL